MYVPLREVEELRSGVMEGSKCVIQALSDIQAEKAEAKTVSDRNMIFEVIINSEGGFLDVNRKVKEGLRS